MATPALVAAGAGATTTGASGLFTLNVVAPTGITLGQLIVVQLVQRSTLGTATLTIDDPTANGWTIWFNDLITPSQRIRQMLAYRYADGTESGGTFNFTGSYTGASNQRMSGRIYRLTGVAPSGTLNESGGLTSGNSNTVSYSPITSSSIEELAMLWVCSSISNAVTPVAGESGGTWAEPIAEYTAGTTTAGTILEVQTAALGIGTITGGTSALLFSSSWAVRSFGLRSIAADTGLVSAAYYDSANETVALLQHDEALIDAYWQDLSVDAIPIELPEDFILGVEFDEFDDPGQTDWNDWSWAQAPPIDTPPEDPPLGIWDSSEFDDPSLTDTTDYSSHTAPLAPNLPGEAQLGIVEDGSQYEDPSFTDQADYASYSDVLGDDAELPVPTSYDASNDFEEPSLTDEADYGSQTDPLSEDVEEDPPLGIIEDGTNCFEDPSFTDEADYSNNTSRIIGNLSEDDSILGIEDASAYEDPSFTDFTPYGSQSAPLSENAPPDLPANLVYDGSEYDSWFDEEPYGTQNDVPIAPAPPVPPVVPNAVPCLRLYVNANVPVTACNLNTFAQTCNVIAELRDLIGQAGIQVFVRGGQEVGDGWGGIFTWSATQIGGDDGLTIIFPTGGATTGAWVKIANVSKDRQFLPLKAAPDANPNGGYIYCGSDGMLHYRGPDSDTVIAPA